MNDGALNWHLMSTGKCTDLEKLAAMSTEEKREMKFVKEHTFPAFDPKDRDIELREYNNGHLFGSIFWSGTLSIAELGQKLLELDKTIVALGFSKIQISLDSYDALFEVRAQKVTGP